MLNSENWQPPVPSLPQLSINDPDNSHLKEDTSLTQRSNNLTSREVDSGIVFAFGKLHSQQSGDVKSTEGTALFHVSNALSPLKFFLRQDFIVSVACGDEHSAFISNTGRLFVIGKNSMGQLGLENISVTQTVTRPTCVKNLKEERVYRVGCGAQHTLLAAETKNNIKRVYAFGINSDMQLGIGRNSGEMCAAPQIVMDNIADDVVNLDGGRSHSAMVLSNMDLYVWGTGPEGQLGLGDQVIECDVPTKMQIPTGYNGFTAVSCGYYHTLTITSPPALFAFGESEDGKLGSEPLNRSDSSISVPILIEIPDADGHVSGVSAGGNHSIVVTSSGRVFSMGLGTDGQLGVGTSIQASTSKPMLLKPFSDSGIVVKSVSAGDSHSAFVTDDGKMFLCGNALHSRLGFDVSANAYIPRLGNLVDDTAVLDTFYKISSVACGGCHTVCLAHKMSGTPSTRPFGDTTNSLLTGTSTMLNVSSARLGRRKRKAEQIAQSLNLATQGGSVRNVTSKSLTNFPPIETGSTLSSTIPETVETINTETINSTTMAMAEALNSAPPNLAPQTHLDAVREASSSQEAIAVPSPVANVELQPIQTAPASQEPLSELVPKQMTELVPQGGANSPQVPQGGANSPQVPQVESAQTELEGNKEEEKPATPAKRSGFSLPLICGGKKQAENPTSEANSKEAEPVKENEANPEQKPADDQNIDATAKTEESNDDNKTNNSDKNGNESNKPATKTCSVL